MSVASSCPRPHAVVMPLPGLGHINPLMHLSRLLAAEGGYIITFVNTERNHERMFPSQTTSKPEGSHLDIRFASIPDGVPADCDPFADVELLFKCFETEMAMAFENLVDKLMKGPEAVTLILSDVLVLKTQDVANKYNLPRVGFWTQGAASFAVHLFCARGYHPPPGIQVSPCAAVLQVLIENILHLSTASSSMLKKSMNPRRRELFRLPYSMSKSFCDLVREDVQHSSPAITVFCSQLTHHREEGCYGIASGNSIVIWQTLLVVVSPTVSHFVHEFVDALVERG